MLRLASLAVSFDIKQNQFGLSFIIKHFFIYILYNFIDCSFEAIKTTYIVSSRSIEIVISMDLLVFYNLQVGILVPTTKFEFFGFFIQ